MQVKMKLIGPLLHEEKKEQIVVLKEINGQRQFPLLIRRYKGVSISRGLKQCLGHRLPKHRRLRSFIERAVISDLQDRRLLALLRVRQNDHVYKIDCQPSDALILALFRDIPIFVEEKILNLLAPKN